MNHRTIRSTIITSSLIAVALASGSAHAVLQGRDLNGSAGSFEAYYDTDLDITWLADANYAKTSGYDFNGLMTWDEANTWAAQLNINGYADWRLPTTTDTGTAGCNFAFSGTDCGWNVDTASSEMAHLYFVTLGNQSFATPTGVESGAFEGGANPNSTLDNTGPFTNFQSNSYWSGTESAPTVAWFFNTYYGLQKEDVKTNSYNALAVSLGDIGVAVAVPEAETYALMLAGLGLIGWRVGRRG